jgi:type II secretory pathway component PulM
MNFWAKSSKRERHIVGGGVALLLTALLYFLLVAPFLGQLAKTRASLPAKKADLAWMQTAALQAEQLRNAKPGQQKTSPLKLIDINARKFGIADNLKRIDPGENNRIKVWFEDLIFVDLMSFLRKLDREHGIEVVSLTADKLNDPGRVNARVTFRTDR